MVEKVTVANVGGIANPAFRDYARRYVDIEEGFREAVAGFGVPFAEPVDEATARRLWRSSRLWVCARSTTGRAWSPAGSPQPQACRLGLHAETYVMTLACPRRCYFCFNPNQADFDGRCAARHPADVVRQLEASGRAAVRRCAHVGADGRRAPALHADEAVAFFARARELLPGRRISRLYTSGARVWTGHFWAKAARAPGFRRDPVQREDRTKGSGRGRGGSGGSSRAARGRVPLRCHGGDAGRVPPSLGRMKAAAAARLDRIWACAA